MNEAGCADYHGVWYWYLNRSLQNISNGKWIYIQLHVPYNYKQFNPLHTAPVIGRAPRKNAGYGARDYTSTCST
jgi:hypothetical protein